MADIVYSTCPLDCPSACALAVQVDGGRLVDIAGWKHHPFTRGVICGKVSRYREIQEGPRVLKPLLRDGPKGAGRFRETTWDEALERVAGGLREVMTTYGAQAVLPFYYGGTLGVIQRNAVERLAHRAGFSRLERTICFSIGEAGWRAGVGKLVGPPPQEVAASDLVVLWGINAVATHLNLMTFVKEARRNGAPLVVVDPYRNHTARIADLHLDPRPGTDGALACAVMQVLLEEGHADREYLARHTDFDRNMEAHLNARTPAWAASITGVPASDIRDFARRFGAAAAPFIRIGLGMSRQRNGAVNVHAVSCLPAVTGAWARKGGGALFATGDAFHIDDEPVRKALWRGQDVRSLDMSRLGRWLTDPDLAPPVAALLVFNANPAGSCPDLHRVHQGLRREDLFTVVHEQVMSDTARFADIVLPATTFLEHSDLYKSYGQYTLQYAPGAFPPRGEARSNHQVVNAIARSLGYADEAFRMDGDAMIDAVLQGSALPSRIEMERQHWLSLEPPARECHFDDGFAHADRRFHFYPAWPDPGMPPKPDHWAVNGRDRPGEAGIYPLDFMTPPAAQVLNTTFSGTASARGHPPRLLLHPADASPRGIRDGDRVRVFNDRGQLTLTAAVTGRVRAGLCLCESNHRADAFPEGISLNSLSHDERVSPRGGAAFHDNRVQVQRA